MTDYPAVMVNANGDETAGDTLSFTDPDNQPASASGPLHAAATGSTPIMVDTPDGDPVISFDADGPAVDIAYDTNVTGVLNTTQGIVAGGEINAGALGDNIPYVTDAAAAPTVYVTPLVFDHTAVIGGLYAWDGSAYVQVGGPVA